MTVWYLFGPKIESKFHMENPWEPREKHENIVKYPEFYEKACQSSGNIKLGTKIPLIEESGSLWLMGNASVRILSGHRIFGSFFGARGRPPLRTCSGCNHSQRNGVYFRLCLERFLLNTRRRRVMTNDFLEVIDKWKKTILGWNSSSFIDQYRATRNANGILQKVQA